MESDREFTMRTLAETKEEVLKSWKGCLVPGFTDEAVLRFLKTPGTADPGDSEKTPRRNNRRQKVSAATASMKVVKDAT